MTRPVYSDADRADLFRGLAHPVRRRVLTMLGNSEHSANQLRSGLKLSQPAMSQHLKVLRDTGLVRQRVEGSQRLYRVNPSTVRKLQRWAAQLA
ncbi:MAG: metalloregulator ArsR/SmtB family transcription factor [Phycisphaerales bacterium]